MHTKRKGTIAELSVASRLSELGWNVLLPLGENCRYDLVAEKNGRFIRVQVKYVTPKNGVLYVNCCSSNNWSVLHYTSEEIDVIAAYDANDGAAYFVPVNQIRKSAICLRLTPTKNGQSAGVRYARDFTTFDGELAADSLADFSSRDFLVCDFRAGAGVANRSSL